MSDRRLVGIDLGIASAHTVRVLDGEANTIAKRKAWPTVESLGEIEAAALAGCSAGTRLEVVMEPTGPGLDCGPVLAGRLHRVRDQAGGDRRPLTGSNRYRGELFRTRFGRARADR